MNEYIYKITNKKNGKSYIGYTKDPERRKHLHFTGKGSKLVWNAIQKYGIDALEFSIIANAGLAEEQSYIELHNTMAPNGYNLCEGGGMPPDHSGKTYEEIYGERAEEQRKRRHLTQLERGGYFNNMQHTEESKKKISDKLKGELNPMYGKEHSSETRKRISESAKERGAFKGSKNPKALHWLLTDPNGVEYRTHGDLEKLCNEHGLSYSTVRASVEKNRPMRSGWTIQKEEQK